jgi:adenosylhomocysteine nucleosidase
LKILVTFAVEPEFAAWRRSRNFVATTAGATTVYGSRIPGAEVDVVLTGMGPANARRAVERVLSTEYTLCISSGFAGALKAEHEVGEVLIAEAVEQIGDRKRIQCDVALVQEGARERGAKKVRCFLTSEKVVGSPEEKARLAEFGDAVEMESYAILSAAAERHIPAVAIRAISDRFDEIMPMDFSEAIDPYGRVRKGKIARDIMSDPRRIPALIRLGRQSTVASVSLIQFLESYMERLWANPPVEILAGFDRVAHR